MVDHSKLKKYLAGTATEDETRECEAFLAEQSNLDRITHDISDEEVDDSLLETLSNLGNRTQSFDSGDSKQLVQQIESLVPCQKIGQDDLDRILSPAESSDELGRIGRYRVIEFIAGGGMGFVFKAEDPKLDRLVCIKVLNPMLASNGDSKTRFAREAKAVSGLRNSRITTVLDFGEHKDLPFLVMELLGGQSLRERLNAEGKLDAELACKFTIQIAQGLQYAHQHGLLHRDIKPENIWVTPEGDIKLLDFGLARSIEATNSLTHSGTILGTPNYMSPEQVQGKELDQRSDLFSVGSVMFEMLTGGPPFRKPNMFSTMMSVANDTLAYPDTESLTQLPKSLLDVIQTLLQKDPSHRPASASELISQLNGSSSPKLLTRSGQNKIQYPSWLVSVAAGAALVAFAFLLYQWNDKGTLVVEADPSVKVEIADEKVSIEDPLTGKKYNVSIGAHPLPSGVYQLELADDSAGYTLSSNVIAIRRGEQQIVRVELKAPNATKPDTNLSKSESPRNIPSAFTNLNQLPTLSAADLQAKFGLAEGKPLFPVAVVSNPAPKPFASTWNIESTLVFSKDCSVNADGSLVVCTSRYDGRSVVIRNRDGEVVHLLPTQGSVVHAAWSPEPNVIAIVENDSTTKQVSVWKLFDNHAEVIDVISCETKTVGWSFDGLKMAMPRSQFEITLVDLAKKGGVYTLPNIGIGGNVSERPWSVGGRYFAATRDEGVKIWDLDERKVVHLFAGMKKATFIGNGSLVSVFDGEAWEIWDLETFQRKSTFSPRSNWLTSWTDPTLRKAIAVTEDKQLIVHDFEKTESANTTIEVDSRFLNSNAIRHYFSVNWSANGQNFIIQTGNGGHFVSGSHSSIAEMAKVSDLGIFSGRYAAIASGNRDLPTSIAVTKNRIAWRNDLYERPGPISVFEMDSCKCYPNSEISIIDTGAQYQISPDGKYLAIVGCEVEAKNGVVAKQYSEDVSKVRICEVETGKVIKTFETGTVHSVNWSPDSESIIVSVAKRIREKQDGLQEDPNMKRLRAELEKTFARYDKNEDGKLVESELPSARMRNLDINGDGEVVIEEMLAFSKQYMKAMPQLTSRSGRSSHVELKTKIINISGSDEIELQAGSILNSESEIELCFQQGRSEWSLAKPQIYNGQIVLPIFDKSTLSGANRTSGQPRSEEELHDFLGMFDIKTGERLKVIELNHQFSGSKLAITDQMISIGHPSEYKNSTIDAFLVLDRKKGNAAFATNSHFRENLKGLREAERARVRNPPSARQIMEPGKAHPSPTHPLIVVESKKSLDLWRLDSNKETFDKICALSKRNAVNESIVWHPSKPIVAWRQKNDVVKSYDATTNTFEEAKHFGIRDLIATDDGWILVGSAKIEKRDTDFNLQKTWLLTERATSDKLYGSYDQCITATGEVSLPERAVNLRAVQLSGNRIETKTIEEFEKQE